MGRSSSAPLAYSQRAHWHLYHSEEHKGYRNVISATHIRGSLSPEALERSLRELVTRHDALRTRIVLDDDGETPRQQIDPEAKVDVQICDPTDLTASAQEETQRQIESLVLEPIDLEKGPLFGARILRLAENEHVLILAAEHIISDAASLEIILNETLASCALTAPLPPVSLQFGDYAIWQAKRENLWLTRHAAYWKENLLDRPRIRFPRDRQAAAAARKGWSMAPVRINSHARAKLVEWCRTRRTSLALGMLTAYAALVLSWCDVREALIRYQTRGRPSPAMHQAVGFFASRLYLRLSLLETDSFVDLLKRVTAEYLRATEHDDFSYWEAQTLPPECAYNTFFNWIPSSPGSPPTNPLTPVPFDNPWFRTLEWDNEPMALLYDDGEEIRGGVYFSLRQLTHESMNRFTATFATLVDQMLQAPEESVGDITESLLRSPVQSLRESGPSARQPVDGPTA